MLELAQTAEDNYRNLTEAQLTAMNRSFQSFSANGRSGSTDNLRSASTSEGSDKLNRPISREAHKQMVIEEQLKQALGLAKPSDLTSPVGKKTANSYPIASAVGRATFAAFGLAAKVLVNPLLPLVDADRQLYAGYEQHHGSHAGSLGEQ